MKCSTAAGLVSWPPSAERNYTVSSDGRSTEGAAVSVGRLMLDIGCQSVNWLPSVSQSGGMMCTLTDTQTSTINSASKPLQALSGAHVRQRPDPSLPGRNRQKVEEDDNCYSQTQAARQSAIAGRGVSTAGRQAHVMRLMKNW